MTMPDTTIATRVVAPADAPLILVDRVVDAPRALVFRMYADPVHLAQFWGPHASTTTVGRFDFRPGGAWDLVIRFPGGGEVAMNNTYLEIVEPERIVFSFPDAPPGAAAGDLVHADIVTTIRFAEEGGGTRITAQMRFASLAARDTAVEMGFATPVAQSLERLEAYLAVR